MATSMLGSRTLQIVVVLAAYLAMAALIDNAYYQLILTSVPIWAVLAIAWNIFSGYTGLLSFGHAAFFGVGAFTVTLLSTMLDVSPWMGIPLAGAAGATSAWLIGLVTFRLRGHYFALAMVAYPFALLYLFNWLGFQEVSLPRKVDNGAAYMQFQNPSTYTALAVALLFVSLMVASYVDRSRFGLILRAIKQDEAAAQASGIDPRRWKMRAFVLSGVLAAMAGGLYVVVLNITTPNEVFGLLVSSNPIVLTLFGGIGSLWGPVIGALALVPLSEVLHAELGSVLPGIQGVIYGLAILLITMWLPEGVYWKWVDGRPRGSRLSEQAVDAIAPAGLTRAGANAYAGATEQPSARTAVLSVQGVSCVFGSLRAVSGVSFDIEAGSITGVVGPNGAGKTTLFNMLNGFSPTTEGIFRLDGVDITGRPTFARARSGIARTFQTARTFPRLSVHDNVFLGAISVIDDEASARGATAWAVALCGMQDVADKPAGSLTAGHVRLLEIARAIASGPKLLLLDETLAGLSSEEVERVLDVIRAIRRAGITVLIIEHTMSAMLKLVDRMIVLDRGDLIADEAPGTVIRQPRVIEAYLGKKWANRA
ncbi:branched-chain amino acid ABC transporter ATP-binding protein/permease [soil metagenome]